MTESEAEQISQMLAKVFPRCKWAKAEWDSLKIQLGPVKGLSMEQAQAVVQNHRAEYDFPKMKALLDSLRKASRGNYAASGGPSKWTQEGFTPEQRTLIDNNIRRCREVLKAVDEQTWDRERKKAKPGEFAPQAALSWKSLKNAVGNAEKMPDESRILDWKVIVACEWMRRRVEVAA